ncbi:hypothetical protein ABTB83_19445, partial [Acinetobacter baumannii]
VVAGFATMLSAQAQAASTAHAESATITGAGSTITASRVPIQTSTGVTYYDLKTTITINATTGVPTAKTTATPSPTLTIGNFQAGTYV